MSDAYHHGDLPNALRAAAADVLAERGPAGFSLREVSRRAGVSHAAPAHHFGDARGLLTAVAVEALQFLTARTQAACTAEADPVDALAAIGRAYVEEARTRPGHCAVLFRADVIDAADPEYGAWGRQAYEVLLGAVRRLADERNPELDVDLAAGMCWAMVHGLVSMYSPLQRLARSEGRDMRPMADLADAFSRLAVSGFAP